MPTCKCSCLPGEEDGIFEGPNYPLSHHYHTTLTNLFKSELAHKKIKGTKQAIVFSSVALTFNELDHVSTAAALNIEKHLGTEFIVTNPDEEILIGICLPISEKLIPLIFAILKLGAAFLPLDPAYPEDLLLAIIHKFRPVMVITDDNGPILSKYDAKTFAEYSKLLCLEEIWIEMELPPEGDPKWEKHVLSKQIELIQPPIPTPPHSRPALVIQTTGLSGNPKGVRIGHMTIINRCLWEWEEYPFKANTVCALTSHVFTVEGFTQVFTALLKGSTLHIFKKSETYNMSALINTLHELKVSRLYFTAYELANFVKTCEKLGKESEEFDHLKFVCCAGDRIIPLEIAKTFFSVFHSDVVLVSYYGGAESCGNLMYTRIKSGRELEKKTVGDRIVLDKVIQNCIVYILSSYLELTKDGVQGEICIAGDPVALGYVDMKEEEDEQRFVNNPHDARKNFSKLFRTGEYGLIEKRNGKRYVYVEGRGDTQVYIRGFPILIEEVVELLTSEEKMEGTEVILYNPHKINQSLISFVQLKDGFKESLQAEKIREALATDMPDILVPDVQVVKEIPRITDGISHRVRPNILLRMYQEERKSKFDSWGKLKFPTNDKLAAFKILAEAMYKFADIPIEKTSESLLTSFYELGGTSLNSLSILLYLNRNGCPLSIKDWVGAANLSELVQLAEERMKKRQSVDLSALKKMAANEVKEKNNDIDKGKDDPGMDNATNKERKDSEKLQPNSDTLGPIFASVLALKEFYEISIMSNSARKDVIQMVSKAYAEKGILERYSLVRSSDFSQFFISFWSTLIDQRLSIIATRISDRKVVACSLNQDFYTTYSENANPKYKAISHLLEYQQELKGSVVHRIPHLRDSVYEISWIATDSSLTPAENVGIVTLLMQENVKLAKQEKYTSLFCLATNPLLKELCLDVFKYVALDDYPAKLFERKTNAHPFRVAPAAVTTSICWLVIGPIPSATSSMKPSVIDTLSENPNEFLIVNKTGPSDGKGDARKAASTSTAKKKK